MRHYKPPVEFKRVSEQYCYFRGRFVGDVLFFQVGRFIEFYQPDDRFIAEFLGLKPLRKNRRGARYGFPINWLNFYFQRLLMQARSVTLIGESQDYLNGIKIHKPRYRFQINNKGIAWMKLAESGFCRA